MKQAKYILYLIVYTGILTSATSQNLSIQLEAEKEISNGLKDSLRLPVYFSELKNLNAEIDTLHQKLLQIGYIESELLQIKKESDSSFIAKFELGYQFSKTKINYENTGISKKELQSITTDLDNKHFSIPTASVPLVLNKLAELQSNKGYPFAKARLTNIEKDENNDLQAGLIIEKEHLRKIDSIVVKGYEKFPRSFLKYFAGIKKGNIFNRQQILNQSEKINSLGFASVTKPAEILFRQDSTSVYVYLKKENNNHFDGILGFATDEESQKLIFNGYLDLKLNNNLNYGEEFLLNYKADGNKQIEFKTRLKISYLFGTRFGLNGELRIFKRDTSFVTTEQRFLTTYQLAPGVESFFGIRSLTSNHLQDEVAVHSPIENFKSFFYVFGGNYLQVQNDKLFPIKTEIGLDIGFGNRTRKSNQEKQWFLESKISHIFRLSPHSSIYTNNSINYLHSNSYFQNELVRFGGINSIRGFQENSIEASFYSILNTEYRYLLNPTIFIHSIIDLGFFKNPINDSETTLTGFGLGMGIKTQGGLFRIILANGKSSNQKFDFSTSKVHISISSRF